MFYLCNEIYLQNVLLCGVQTNSMWNSKNMQHPFLKHSWGRQILLWRGGLLAKFWGRDNLPTWQAATCLSTGQRGWFCTFHIRGLILRYGRVMESDDVTIEVNEEILKISQRPQICVVKKCFGCVLISQGWTRHILKMDNFGKAKTCQTDGHFLVV